MDPTRRHASDAVWQAASPHTRGWTPDQAPDRRTRQGTGGLPRTRGDGPEPRQSSGGRSGWRLPRTRGDGPVCGIAVARSRPSVASPHTRGWTPAHTLLAEVDPRGLPRTRGDGPGSEVDCSAPDPWGFPAHAGMDPCRPGRPSNVRFAASPHTRGWTRRTQRLGPIGREASPHTRGWTPPTIAAARGTGGPRLPRTRGDGPAMRLSLAPSLRREGFPAHAGMDPSRRMPCSARFGNPRLPRTRGDGPTHSGRVLSGSRRLPRTRGDGPRAPRRRRRARRPGFPAHAGMDPRLGS